MSHIRQIEPADAYGNWWSCTTSSNSSAGKVANTLLANLIVYFNFVKRIALGFGTTFDTTGMRGYRNADVGENAP